MKLSLDNFAALTIVVFCCAFATASCNSASAARREALAANMKGWELYSWPVEHGAWHFALLEGSNDVKSLEMIRDPLAEMHGVDELLAKLDRLPAGEFITWCAPRAPVELGDAHSFPLPPDAIVSAVVERARRDQLTLALP